MLNFKQIKLYYVAFFKQTQPDYIEKTISPINPKLKYDNMRKAILFLILALSINAYAQIKQPTISKELLLSGKRELLREGIRQGEGKIRNVSLSPDKRNSFIQQGTTASPFSPIYDDVYRWKRDIPGNRWVYESRSINIVYDVNSNLLSSVEQIWNGSIWVNDQQVTYTYNLDRVASELWQKWTGSAWVNDSYYTTSYDANSNITLELAQLWSGSAWQNDFQSLYTYDANNNQITFTQKIWDGSVWGNSYQEISSYNSDKNRTEKLSQFWDGSAWINGFRDKYTYNAGKKLISIVDESYIDVDVWENFSQTLFTYDTNNNITNELEQLWNGSGWENGTNFIFVYDANNNQKTKTVQTWNGASWIQSALSSYTYDLNNFVESEANRNWTNAVLTSGDSTFYHFHTIPTGTNDLQTETISLYPNPGNGRFTIKSNSLIDKIEVYNMSGEKVYSDIKNSKQNSFETDISYCSKGIYLLKVYAGKVIVNRKVIIK